MILCIVLIGAFYASVWASFIAKDKFKDRGLLAGLGLSLYLACRIISMLVVAFTGKPDPFLSFVFGVACLVGTVNIFKRSYQPGWLYAYIDAIQSHMPMKSFNPKAMDMAFNRAAKTAVQPEEKYVEEIDDETYASLANN